MTILFAAFGGFLLGLLHLYGLLWTTQQLPRTRHPLPWLVASMLVRTALLLAGLWFLGRGDALGILVAAGGAVMARLLLLRRFAAAQELQQ